MNKIKSFAVEYLYWLYIVACFGWLILRLAAFAQPGFSLVPVFLGLPLLLAIGSGLFLNCVGCKVMGTGKSGSFWKYQIGIGVALSLVMAWVIVEVKPVAFFTGAVNTGSILQGIFNPNPDQLVADAASADRDDLSGAFGNSSGDTICLFPKLLCGKEPDVWLRLGQERLFLYQDNLHDLPLDRGNRMGDHLLRVGGDRAICGDAGAVDTLDCILDQAL
jgi:hypothetical protein